MRCFPLFLGQPCMLLLKLCLLLLLLIILYSASFAAAVVCCRGTASMPAAMLPAERQEGIMQGKEHTAHDHLVSSSGQEQDITNEPILNCGCPYLQALCI